MSFAVKRTRVPLLALALVPLLTACPRLTIPPNPQAGEMTLLARARTWEERAFPAEDEYARVGANIALKMLAGVPAEALNLPAGYAPFTWQNTDFLGSAEAPPHLRANWKAVSTSGGAVLASITSRADVTHLYMRVEVSSADPAVNPRLVEEAIRRRIIAEPGITLVAREQ